MNDPTLNPCNEPGPIQDTNIDYQSIISEILLLADIFSIVDNQFIDRINLIYPLIIDNTNHYNETENQIIKLIKEFKQKFESKFMIQ